MQKPINILISGGGTGGHIFPAIAIANEIKRRKPDANILFVGAENKMEMEKVPKAGYKIEGLWISGFQRSFDMRNLSFPFKLIASYFKSGSIVKSFKPDVAIGTGGFASGPLLQIASLSNIPSLIQEQNSYPGITNKLLSKKANKICVAYEGLERFFPSEKLIVTGNPVRQDIVDCGLKRAEALVYFNLNENKKTLLILGGSLGSKRINELIAAELNFLLSTGVQIFWQCGNNYMAQYKHFSETQNVQVVSFIDRMDLVYAAADFILSRAGASSVSELCLVGKPVIFIPSPNVAEDHQTKNAQAIASQQGALVIKESELEKSFQKQWSRLQNDTDLQDSLKLNIQKLAKPNATKDIVNQIVQLLA